MTRTLYPALAGIALIGSAGSTLALAAHHPSAPTVSRTADETSLSLTGFDTPAPSGALPTDSPLMTVLAAPALGPVRSRGHAPRSHRSRHTTAARRLRPVSRLMPSGPAQTGVASYYDAGATTADGEQFDPDALTAASPDLPFGTELEVCVTGGGPCVLVRVNDRGPFVPGRFLDLTPAGAAALGYLSSGTAEVTATPVSDETVLVSASSSQPEVVGSPASG